LTEPRVDDEELREVVDDIARGDYVPMTIMSRLVHDLVDERAALAVAREALETIRDTVQDPRHIAAEAIEKLSS